MPGPRWWAPLRARRARRRRVCSWRPRRSPSTPRMLSPVALAMTSACALASVRSSLQGGLLCRRPVGAVALEVGLTHAGHDDGPGRCRACHRSTGGRWPSWTRRHRLRSPGQRARRSSSCQRAARQNGGTAAEPSRSGRRPGTQGRRRCWSLGDPDPKLEDALEWPCKDRATDSFRFRNGHLTHFGMGI